MGVKRDWISTLTSFEGYESHTLYQEYTVNITAGTVCVYVCNSLAYVCMLRVGSVDECWCVTGHTKHPVTTIRCASLTQ